MNKLKSHIFLSLCICCTLAASAQAPNGSGIYYLNADGLQFTELKTALYNIIANHTKVSYSSLWTHFEATDTRPDGTVWDIYSSVTRYDTATVAHAHNYEGSGINREHTFPSSWFSLKRNDRLPMYTDLFQLMPVDGYLNNRRSNYPYGETEEPTFQSEGGFSKLGPSSVEGYSGVVFEPNDLYKGDLARTYFYMATCYEDSIAEWPNRINSQEGLDVLDGSTYPAFADWLVPMLLRWAADDPVSQKEIDRNEAVFKIQGNRNPFIDYPGLERLIWGDKQETVFHFDRYNEDENPEDDPPLYPDPEVIFSATLISSFNGFTPSGTNGVWKTSIYGAKASGYDSVTKTNFESDAQLISPVIDLRDFRNVMMSFQHDGTFFKGTESENATVEIREAGTDEWEKLQGIIYFPTQTKWAAQFTNSGNIDLSAFEGKQIQLAFHYKSTTQVGGNWEVKNLELKGQRVIPTGIMAHRAVDPNHSQYWYTLQGIRLSEPPTKPGIYIFNGKRYLIK